MKLVQLRAEELMSLRVNCPEEARLWVGQNDFGLLRAICITGGTFKGERLRGTVVPGGADWNTGFGGDSPENFTSVDVFAKYLLKTDDGVYIAIENQGKRDKTKEQPYIITTPRFFAPRGKYEWLNYGAYTGSLNGSIRDGVNGVDITIYRML
ncbi:DUF3237 domain-containing protein [Treponema sp. OttesenSCG-928-L16]|nr:DUF3237 domain-containing protein [Treponema sp. OttesenSCG-928-L16]